MTYERNLRIGVDGYTNDELVLNVYGDSLLDGNVSILGITTVVGILTATEIYGIFKGTVDASVSINSSNYSIKSGISTYSNFSGIATYSNSSGISTISQGLTGTPNIVVGIVTANTLYGSFNANQLTGSLPAIDGSALLNVISTGVGVIVQSNGTPVGTANSINFSENLYLNFSQGIATVTAFGGYWAPTSVGIHTLSNVGVGTTNPGSKLTVTGDVFITGIVTATDFNSASDIKLKEDIYVIENPIDSIMKLDGVNFKWKESGKESMGVIAQQVEKIIPKIVSGDDIKTVNYNGLVGLLIEVVKEQQNQINELKDKFNK